MPASRQTAWSSAPENSSVSSAIRSSRTLIRCIRFECIREDLVTGRRVRERDLDHPVEPAGPEQGRVEHVHTVRRGHDPDAPRALNPSISARSCMSVRWTSAEPEVPSLVRIDPMASISSMKTIEGARSRASEKSRGRVLRPLADELVDELRARHPDEGPPPGGRRPSRSGSCPSPAIRGGGSPWGARPRSARRSGLGQRVTRRPRGPPRSAP